MGIISKIIQNFQKSRHRPLTDFAHPFCPYFTENFYRFMHNLRRCFCPRFSQKPLQLKGYFKVARAIFPPLFTPKFFSHQAFSNTAALAIAQLPPPCTDASMSVFRHTPLPKRNSLIVSRPCSNELNLHQNFKRRYTRQTPPSTGKTLPRARYRRA